MSSNPIFDTAISPEVTSEADSKWEKVSADRPVSLGRRLRRLFWHLAARQLTLLCVVALKIAGWVGRRRRPLLPGEGCEIILTGRFDSDNWILAHLGPLAASKECSRVWMVSTNPVPAIPKVVAIYPPKWLMKAVGVTPARLLVFARAAMRKQPHVVGGFNLTMNAVAAAIVGRLAGARAAYFCVGGPAEVRDGGIHAEQHLFTKMESPDPIVEKRLLGIISTFDIIITMGTRAVDFFRNKGVDADFHVVSGGIDTMRFRTTEEPKSFDLIMTGRLVRIKRIDVFLQAVCLMTKELPGVSAVIVGDGMLRDELQQLARDLGIDRHVSLVGCQNDVENWLRRARIFALTSDSEGLSLSMMEAMMCGLPTVVSDVGDLGDLVESGVNGYLVPRRCPELFAARIIELLSDSQKLETFSHAARRSAMRYETQATMQRWDNIIANYRTS